MPLVRREELMCASLPGHKWCPIMSGKSGHECVDILNTLDSCGGCATLGDEDGRDCSSIPNVDEVKCERGRCKIKSCQKGYVPGQGACVPIPGHAKAKRAGILHARHDSF
ncbi:proprotein convertase subtilisin/kexin type 5 [Ceratobasidium sp. AG-Ba]|nr:proprotein convertase subtilisin/kexin type 5 [Ceratobasidium sp. AG-Ba]